jgi:hypothetical protein
METTWVKTLFLALLLLCTVMCLALPVAAAEGMITITYRGSGGNYIGDTIIFDGKNTAGNTTMIKITGPGLPPQGVPLYNLGGTPGSGNTAKVDAENKWIYVWDSSRADASKLQTARYTFIASDPGSPEQTATTSILLIRPEFYLVAAPASPGIGDYVEIEGMAEKGVTYVKIAVLNSTGTVLHTFISPVSSTGSFGYGFHVDMGPGQYNIIGSNPSMKNNLVLTLTVAAPKIPATTQPVSSLNTPVPAEPYGTAMVTTIPQMSFKTGIEPTTILLALCIFGTLLFVRSGLKKKW